MQMDVSIRKCQSRISGQLDGKISQITISGFENLEGIDG